MVQAANPGAAALIGVMAAEHGAVQCALDAFEEALAGYARSAGGRAGLAAALASLDEVLLPHLRREEEEMMPVVSASITCRQWHDWDQAHNVKPLGLRELAFTGNWLLDDLCPADRAIVEAEVPPVPRWIVKNSSAPATARRCCRCWRLPEHTSLRAPLSSAASVRAGAPPEAVWRLLPVEPVLHGHRVRAAERVQVLHAGPAAGRRDRMALHARARRGRDPDHPALPGTPPAGVGRLPVWADRLLWRLTPAHHDRHPALVQDLQRLAGLAEREHVLTGSAQLAWGGPARTLTYETSHVHFGAGVDPDGRIVPSCGGLDSSR